MNIIEAAHRVVEEAEEKLLVDRPLEKDCCALCNGPIDEEWAGKNPSLGTKCRTCPWETPVFEPENVHLRVSKKILFNPLFDMYEYDFEWRGSKVKVNGEVGLLRSTQGDGSWVDFDDDETSSLGTFVKGLGYQSLARLYEASGGDSTPPPTFFTRIYP